MSKVTVRTALVVVALVSLGLAAVTWLRDSAHEVRPNDLDDLLDRADRVVVRREPSLNSEVLYESSDRRDLDALKTALRVEPPPETVYCRCEGGPALYLYAGRTALGVVTNHHARRLRYKRWTSDAPLADPEALLRWFDARGVEDPRREYEADRARQAKGAEAERRWVAAMPASLQPLWPAARRSFDPDLTPLRAALVVEFPDQSTRIRALFSWYGSGEGPWSGFPAYESVAEQLLLDYPTADLVGAASVELNPAQAEGCARLFGGGTFSAKRPNDLALLPPDLKARLLKHSLASADEDKRNRARGAFSGR